MAEAKICTELGPKKYKAVKGKRVVKEVFNDLKRV